jgi:hypothetical protein
MSNELEQLPRLLREAAATYAKEAATAAELLEALKKTKGVYEAGRLEVRFRQVKDALDTTIAVIRQMQVDALVIDSLLMCRLANEYDAAQDKGDLPKRGDIGRGRNSDDKFLNEITGFTIQHMHKARNIRNAEKAKPGCIRKALDEQVAAGEEPTRAALQRAVNEALGKKPRPRGSNGSAKDRIKELEAELSKLRRQYSDLLRAQAQGGVITRDEFRKIMSCLHPDRFQDPDDIKRYTEAFQIFQNFEIFVVEESRKAARRAN